jgi:predicted RNA binding protein YcfA (HicA-like mRNA interferase family)
VNARELIKKIEQAGWVQVRVKGSHHHFKHPRYSRLVTVPVHKGDLPKGLVEAILKQTGLN